MDARPEHGLAAGPDEEGGGRIADQVAVEVQPVLLIVARGRGEARRDRRPKEGQAVEQGRPPVYGRRVCVPSCVEVPDVLFPGIAP